MAGVFKKGLPNHVGYAQQDASVFFRKLAEGEDFHRRGFF